MKATHLTPECFPEVFKYRGSECFGMQMPSWMLGLTAGLLVGFAAKKSGLTEKFGADMGISEQPYMTRNMTPADYEEAYVESSGATADIIPVVMSDAFVGSYMGKELLDLQMTTNCFNDDPWGGPITDVQAYWENPYAPKDYPTCNGEPIGPNLDGSTM